MKSAEIFDHVVYLMMESEEDLFQASSEENSRFKLSDEVKDNVERN